MKSTATSHRLFGLLLSVAFILVPAQALASVLITEVMYDLPGSDSGREWVEITNTGSDPVDVSKYRFFEGGTNHALTLSAGSATLAAGQAAVIADNAAKFLGDWPQYGGTLFDSSFSLSNTGETVALKDDSLNVLDSVTYSSDGGAAGDGNTLHRSGDTLVPGAPDPGTYTGSAPAPVPDPAPAPNPAPAADTTSTSTSTSATTTDSTSATSTPATDSTTASTTATTTTATTTGTASTTPAATAPVTPTSAHTTAQTSQSSQSAQTTSTQTTPSQTQAPAPAAATSPTSSSGAQSSVTPTHAQTTPQPSGAKTGSALAANKSKPSLSAPSGQVAGAQTDIPYASAAGTADPLWIYVLGLAALVIVGVAGALYVRRLAPVAPASQETAPVAQEFEIEG